MPASSSGPGLPGDWHARRGRDHDRYGVQRVVVGVTTFTGVNQATPLLSYRLPPAILRPRR